MVMVIGVLTSLRYLAYVQQNNYRIFANKKLIVFWVINFICIVPYVVIEHIMEDNDLGISIKIISLCLTIVFIYFLTVRKDFLPRFTRRALSIYLINSIIIVAIATVICSFIKYYSRYINVFILILCPAFVIISNFTVYNYFEKKNKNYIRIQANKLRDLNVKVIAITGSFGKTSCKNILAELLSSKYTVAKTKSNYNTPMGIAKTIEGLSGREDILIVEMGARYRGDIKELCELYSPLIGVITGVCRQHIKTFGSIHNIYLEKQELSKATPVCFFNGNDKYSLKMFKERKGQKYKSCVGKCAEFFSDNIIISDAKTYFTLHDGDHKIDVSTRLLGKTSVQNITLCATVAKYLGVTLEDIKERINNLTPVPHRLEYICRNGIHILDDGYNANELGIRYSMEVIDSFYGRKVIVAQGIAEGGKLNRVLNADIGEQIARHFDIIILCGSNRRYIKIGLKNVNYDGKIYSFSSLKKAQKEFGKILKKGDVLLLQNDIPFLL